MHTSEHGRHRAAGRPSTPLSEFSSLADFSALAEIAQSVVAGKMPRRLASVAAVGGLVFTTFGAAAATRALPADIPDRNALELAELADLAPLALAPAPVVEIPADLEIEFEGLDHDEVVPVEATPAPEPEPEPEPAPVFAAASNFGASVATIAARYQGVPYLWGGTTPAGFDCSGFTQYVFRQVGINLPRTSAAQRGAGTVVSSADARPGDLVWWSGHTAIYLGDGMIIDAPQPGGVVSIRAMFRPSPTFIRLG